MRMLFSSTAGYGSLHPLIAFALAARGAGHDVLISTTAERAELIEGLGFAFAPAGTNPHAEMRRRHPDIPLPPTGNDSPRQVRDLLFGGLYIEAMLPGLLDASRSWRPDVIVHGHLALAPLMAAEELDIPHATIEEASSGELAQNEAMFHGPLARWRAERALTPDPDMESIRRYLWLSPFPASIRHPDAPFGPTARRTRPLIFNETQQAPPPGWLDDLPAAPVVHASLGTFVQRPELLRSIVAGLAGEPLTVVLATGTPQLLEGLGPLPANVRAAPFVPHTQLLPKCDALITHAGAGTLITGIMHGLPMAMVPIFGDQPPNAERAASAGAGIMLDQATLTPEGVRDATAKLLSDPSYRESSRRIRDEALSLPDHREAVGWLEHIARHRTPPP